MNLLSKIFKAVFIIAFCHTFSACTDKNEPAINEDDLSQNSIVDVLDSGMKAFENAVSSTDPEQAKEASRSDLLKSELVREAEVLHQGILVTFSDNTQGFIMTDALDAPEYDKIPDTPERSTHLKSQNSLNQSPPGIKKTIFINPHYYERKKFADWLIDTYNSYLPMAGYEKPDVYLNQECTLDLLTCLGDYGIIHIYSHGIKFSGNVVYLLCGEKINTTTTNKYRDYIKTLDVLPIRIKDVGILYMVSPDFISDHNEFKDENKLVYGGFCYSFLGGWPQMFYENYEGGYFGFDNAVYTDMNVKWAKDLFYNLSYPYNFEPENALNWRFNTTLGNSYLNNDVEEVSIKYMGLSNLTLWEWETNVWNHKYFEFSVKIDATLQLKDGSVKVVRDTVIHQCTGEGSFTQNTYAGKSLRWRTYKEAWGGYLSFVLNPISYSISDFSISDTTGYNLMEVYESDMMQCSVSELPYASTTDPFVDGADFVLKGDEMKNRIKQLSDYFYQKTGDTEISERLIDYSISDNSEIRFQLLWSR